MTDEPVEPDSSAPVVPPLLLGTYNPKIDAKGRMAIPAKDTDKQGRVVVPQMLREYADLGDDIVVIGVGTRAEIWNRKAWEQYLSDNEPEYSDIADDVLPDLEF